MDIFVPELLGDEASMLDTVECVVHHIIYMRDLSPAPIAELRSLLTKDNEGMSRGMKRYLLKVRKFVTSIDNAMQGLACLLQSNKQLMTVCCYLGSSNAVAREAYYIHLHCNAPITASTDAARVNAKKHLIRQFISIWNGIDLSATSTKSLYVSFEFKDIVAEQGSSSGSSSGTSSIFNEKAEFRLKIKNNLTLKRKAESSRNNNNSKEIHINIRKRGTTETGGSDVRALPTKWFVMKRSIKGLKKQR